MGLAKARHRPLRGGIQVIPGDVKYTKDGNIESISQVQTLQSEWVGTLSGLAIRNLDQVKVLVTNLHVLVGLSDPEGHYRNKTGREELFQGSLVEGDRVGGTVTGEIDLTGTNEIDAGYCPLQSGVLVNYTLHDHPDAQDNSVHGVPFAVGVHRS